MSKLRPNQAHRKSPRATVTAPRFTRQEKKHRAAAAAAAETMTRETRGFTLPDRLALADAVAVDMLETPELTDAAGTVALDFYIGRLVSLAMRARPEGRLIVVYQLARLLGLSDDRSIDKVKLMIADAVTQ